MQHFNPIPPVVVSNNPDTNISVSSVNPPSWWVGMTDPSLTILVSGHNVALARPSVSPNSGISIKRTVLTDSVNHMFIEVELDPQAEPSTPSFQLTYGSQVVAQFPFQLLPRRKGSAQRVGFDQSDAVYLAMPDRFANDPNYQVPSDAHLLESEDRNNPYGRHGGNLDGIRKHIDYIYSLGMTALWLTPVLANNMPQQSYHGYAITDFYSVDPRLGSLSSLRMLVASLHQRGMKFIMDLVVNHCGTNHPWLASAPSSSWFCSWGGQPWQTNYAPQVVADIHAAKIDRLQTINGWFDVSMADLNMADPLLAQYMAQVAIWWIEMADLDGIRMDTYPYAHHLGMSIWTQRIQREYPNFSIVGETWVGSPAQLAPWQRGGVGQHLMTSQLQFTMDFPLQDALTDLIRPSGSVSKLYHTIASDVVYANPNDMLIFLDNHDTGRALSTANNNIDSLKLTLACLVTMRGIPQLLYATEMLMAGSAANGHADIRRDMPGGWSNDKQDWFAAAAESLSPQQNTPSTTKPTKLHKNAQTHSIAVNNFPLEQRQQFYAYVARLFTFRKKCPTIHYGTLIHFLPQDNIYVYFRILPNHPTILTILNAQPKRKTLKLQRFQECIGESLTGQDIISGRKFRQATKLTLSPRTPLIIQIPSPTLHP